MLHRHRVPTIFSIYMLDVICCALGCVILLWQIAHQEAETQSEQATKQASAAELARLNFEHAKTDLLKVLSEVAELRNSLEDANAKKALVEKDREYAQRVAMERQDALDKAGRELRVREDRLKKLEEELSKWLSAHAVLAKQIEAKEKVNVELLAQLALANSNIDSLKGQVAAKLADFQAENKKLKEQTVALQVSQQQARELDALLKSLRDKSSTTENKLKLTELQLKVREEDLDRTRKDLALLITTRDQLQKDLFAATKDRTDGKSQISSLMIERDQLLKKLDLSAKDLAGANLALGNLRLDKDKLAQRVASLESDLDQRFAGIPLTGENVVFLIDVSGSMVMKDENYNPDPDKWPEVCDTVMKLMRSIPTMRRFQVILFSDKTTHLFGQRDQWFSYDGAKTAKQVRDALLREKPDGGTNMHAGFEEAFRYRKTKLDTIYLFSDGLPTQGPGVPTYITKPSEAEKNLYMAKHVRDKLKTEWNAPNPTQPQVRINAVGFYFESPDVGAFLWALAREHKGNFVGLR